MDYFLNHIDTKCQNYNKNKLIYNIPFKFHRGDLHCALFEIHSPKILVVKNLIFKTSHSIMVFIIIQNRYMIIELMSVNLQLF